MSNFHTRTKILFRRVALTFCSFLSLCNSFAQTYTHPTTGISGTYAGDCVTNTCSGTYTDDNTGAGGDYKKNVNSIYRVFCPNTAYQCMSATFSSFVLENPTGAGECTKDYLTVGNGATQNSTLISIAGYTSPLNRLCGTLTPFTVTSTDASGCLSFRFTSNASNQYAGWSATLSCVPCAGGPSGTDNNDCINSQTICYDVPLASVDNGPGLVSEGCVGCLAAGENYSTWYDFCFATGGTLALTIDPVTNTDDYDFALYDYADCASLAAPIRCSYSGVTGNTGMKASAADLSEGATGDSWVSTLNVTAGDCYYLLINHWTPPVTGYTIDWTLTAGATFDPCIFLPVTLTSFTAEPVENNTIALTWITETEMNNDHYLVEKSPDGIHFEEFATVDGKMNSTEKTIYYLVDMIPFSGDNYYRLSEVNVNGDVSFLQTVATNINFNDAYGTMMVYDISGKIVFNEIVYRNQIDQLLETLHLDKGVYVYNYIQNNGYIQTDKFSTIH